MRDLKFIASTLIVFVFVSLGAAIQAVASDKENCLMCHKYPFIGRIDETGKTANYHVDEAMFKTSIHRNVACRDCHTGIKKIPHDPVKTEVNCANECHIKPPFSDEKFSHEKIIKIYNGSIHAITPEDSPELKKAKPYCKYCHLNPKYERVEEERIAYDETLRRCQNCHKKRGVTQAYKHMTHRLRKKTTRTPQEVVALCRKCHEDTEMMSKLNVSKENLISVETYDASIHGKSVMLGSKKAADCVSCHATNAIHDIYKRDDERSTVSKKNVMAICGQCHDSVDPKFAKLDVHPTLTPEDTPHLYYLKVGLRLALYQTVFGLLALFFLETRARRRDGGKWQVRRGTIWRQTPDDGAPVGKPGQATKEDK